MKYMLVKPRQPRLHYDTFPAMYSRLLRTLSTSSLEKDLHSTKIVVVRFGEETPTNASNVVAILNPKYYEQTSTSRFRFALSHHGALTMKRGYDFLTLSTSIKKGQYDTQAGIAMKNGLHIRLRH